MAGQPNSPDAPQFNLRLADEKDIEVLLEMGKRFYDESPLPAYAEWDEDSAAAHIFHVIDNGVIIVAEHVESGSIVGMIGLLCTPWPYNANVMLASEVVFYIVPEHRGTTLAVAMKECAEAAAELEGCQLMSLMTLSTTPPTVDKLYRRAGFQPTETAYLKVL